jgi:4'-phosphopantetheinyl transferase
VEVVPVIELQTADIQLTWPSPPPRMELAGEEVHVWSAWLGHGQADDSASLEMLSEDERARSAKFRFERDRKAFVARRSLLRAILGHYLKVKPWQITLAYEERGKPRVSAPVSAAPFHFSFSHSRGLGLCAVSRFAPLGVDVERIRPMPEMAEIGAAFCAVQENALLNAAPPEKKLEVFFSIWTRKEAYLKATGEGIAGALAQLDCSQAPPGWSLHALSPAPGFVGALAFPGSAARPLCWRWERPPGWD